MDTTVTVSSAPMYKHTMQIIARWLGYGVMAALIVGVLAILHAALKVATYDQAEEPASLARKVRELERMSQAVDMAAPRPNVVVILFDDLGYGDLGAFGSQALETPRLDALAAQGIALDHYYSPSATCSPSRAGLLTGRWPVRTTLSRVVFPTGSPFDMLLRWQGQPVRLPADEITVAEGLRGAGYATGFVGKWHLGDHEPSLPQNFGFEHWMGLLYSNDMTPLPLWRNNEIIEPDPVDQTTLTPRYTAEAIEFIEANREGPFFLYLAHTFPHIPLYTTDEQRGKSDAGLYGDVMADLDTSTGAIVDALDRLSIADDTLVIVTSDNGPWFQGSAGNVRGRKGESFDGGMRVPFFARWPGHIAAGRRTDAVASGVDLFPTLLGLAGVPVPSERIIDGANLMPVFTTGERREEAPIYYYAWNTLEAVRLGRYKWQSRRGIVYPEIQLGPFAIRIPNGPWLFDLDRDPDESYDVHERHPDAFVELSELAETFETQRAKNPRGWLDPPDVQ